MTLSTQCSGMKIFTLMLPGSLDVCAIAPMGSDVSDNAAKMSILVNNQLT